jgi:glycosyltransferase involved in cell wall biosynthesis
LGLKHSIKKANLVIVDSESTKRDVISFYPFVKNKIQRIYLGTNENKFPSSNSFKKKYPYPYFIFVGTIEPRKNIDGIIRAFNRYDGPEHLIIVGKKGWKYKSVIAEFNISFKKNIIHFTDFVSENELSYLYNNATASLYISHYEGFGFPILESMARSCPVITSNNSSLPEVGGDAALYVNPKNTDSVVSAMRKIKDPKVRQKFILLGRKNISRFSWVKTAKETLKCYNNLV